MKLPNTSQTNGLPALLLEVLSQEAELLEVIPDRVYTARSEDHFASSIGSHIRHNLDHFSAFFAGLPTGYIDYEHRGREESIASSKERALEVVRHFINTLLRNAVQVEARTDEEVRNKILSG